MPWMRTEGPLGWHRPNELAAGLAFGRRRYRPVNPTHSTGTAANPHPSLSGPHRASALGFICPIPLQALSGGWPGDLPQVSQQVCIVGKVAGLSGSEVGEAGPPYLATLARLEQGNAYPRLAQKLGVVEIEAGLVGRDVGLEQGIAPLAPDAIDLLPAQAAEALEGVRPVSSGQVFQCAFHRPIQTSSLTPRRRWTQRYSARTSSPM